MAVQVIVLAVANLFWRHSAPLHLVYKKMKQYLGAVDSIPAAKCLNVRCYNAECCNTEVCLWI